MVALRLRSRFLAGALVEQESCVATRQVLFVFGFLGDARLGVVLAILWTIKIDGISIDAGRRWRGGSRRWLGPWTLNAAGRIGCLVLVVIYETIWFSVVYNGWRSGGCASCGRCGRWYGRWGICWRLNRCTGIYEVIVVIVCVGIVTLCVLTGNQDVADDQGDHG